MLNHIAIIPDGNRRWAKQKGLKPTFGHYKSASYSKLMSLLKSAIKQNIKYLTIWGFSTDNWKRNDKEVKAIFKLLEDNLEKFTEEAHKNEIRFRHVGRRDRLPVTLLKQFQILEGETEKYDKLNVQICLDYGGRDEILRAVNQIKKHKCNTLIDEKMFSNFLDTIDIPDIDLIIRTSGERRLSGFMLWQGAYAELYFTRIHFPDFTGKHLRMAVEDFKKRQRRYGG